MKKMKFKQCYLVLTSLLWMDVDAFVTRAALPHARTVDGAARPTAFKYSSSLNVKHLDDYFPDKDDTDEILTKESFLRNMLKDPETKRKKKNGSGRYKTIDNRDNLPFLVKVITPDPYTPIAEKKKEAIDNTRKDREKTASKNGGKQKKVTRDLLGRDKGIAASIYTQQDDGSLQKILGEFNLDKSTTSGDVIDFGEKTFQVQKARCQFKYAGGQKFFMVRKILEVKDVTRVETEEKILKTFKDSEGIDSDAHSPTSLE